MFKRMCPIILMIVFITSGSFAQEEGKSLSLSLEDCVLKAMRNNLGVSIAVMTPELSDIAVSFANEKFMPNLSFSFSKRDTSSPSYSFLDAREQVSTLTDNYSAQLSQLIPTGASFSVTLDGYKTDTNRSFQTINPRYGSTLTFDFTQPLLRNFGFRMSRREIIIAQNNLDISLQDLKTNLQNTVYSVEEAYWNLVYSIELLKVRQQSLDLARDLLEKNKRAVEIGTMAPIEVLNAQATVATREADILDAEAQVLNNEDILKTIINLEAEMKGADSVRIVPSEKPVYEKREVNLEEAIATALMNRPDLEATRIDIKNREFNLSYAKNQLLPDLSLRASYWSPGITGDQILYLNNNAFTGIIVGTIPGSASDALKDAFNFKYKNWSLGLTLTLPLNSLLSRASYAQARVNLEQSALRLKNQEQQAFLEIKTAVRAVQTNYQRVEAYRVARELAEKQLEAEEEKLRVGMTTNYFVLQYQRDLATAQSQELRAIVDYNLSLARLNRSLGISLEEKNIKVSEILSQ